MKQPASGDLPGSSHEAVPPRTTPMVGWVADLRRGRVTCGRVISSGSAPWLLAVGGAVVGAGVSGDAVLGSAGVGFPIVACVQALATERVAPEGAVGKDFGSPANLPFGRSRCAEIGALLGRWPIDASPPTGIVGPPADWWWPASHASIGRRPRRPLMNVPSAWWPLRHPEPSWRARHPNPARPRASICRVASSQPGSDPVPAGRT